MTAIKVVDDGKCLTVTSLVEVRCPTCNRRFDTRQAVVHVKVTGDVGQAGDYWFDTKTCFLRWW